jgi:tRNA/tmRNA/rRNA uracil-C5-methylase (TrmA/RlmC/RlmD family)
MRYFSRSGYEARTEKEVWRNRKGRIDVFAQKGNYSVGIEVDDCSIRMNSIEKLNALKPSLAVFVLKGHKYNWKKTYARFKYLKTKSLVIHLQSGQYKWIYPKEKEFCKINESADFQKRDFSKCSNTGLKNLNGAKTRPVSGSSKPISRF